MNFKRKVIERVNHAADAATHLSGLAFAPVFDELRDYAQAGPGWDGPGSVPPTPEAAKAAARFVGALVDWATVPDVSLASDGEISVYWRDDSSYVDVSFRRANRVSLYARINGRIFKAEASDPDRLTLPTAVAFHLAPL